MPAKTDVGLATLDRFDDGVKLHVLDLNLQTEFGGNGSGDFGVNSHDLVTVIELVRGRALVALVR